MSTTLSKYCLGPHVETTPGHRPPVVAHQRACNNLSKPPRTATVGAQLSPPRLHTNSMDLTTGTSSIILSMYCNRRISMVIRTKGICICATTRMTTSKTVGSRLSSHRQQRRICTTCKQGHRPPNKNATGETLWSDRTVGICLCAVKEMSTTLKNCPYRQ